MSDNLHIRAQKLAAQSLVEGLTAVDQTWLNQHLSECPDCTREVATTSDILHALRNVPVAIPSDLAARTQLRVRMRAESSAQTSSGVFFLWLIAGMSWFLGLLSAPIVWHGFAWVGEHFGVPKLALQAAFMLWWAIPALVAVSVVLHQKAAGSRI